MLEAIREGLHYTPHTYLGVALPLLFAARIAYRIVEVVWLLPPSQGVGLHSCIASPLTMAVFLWRRRVLAARCESEAAAPC